jgi:hypothetical protein
LMFSLLHLFFQGFLQCSNIADLQYFNSHCCWRKLLLKLVAKRPSSAWERGELK